MGTPATSIEIRRATHDDVPMILQLGRRALGWLGDEYDARFFRWKHFENPFGESPMWVAEVAGEIVGFRTFLRWRFETAADVLPVVRAVDTATDPDYQGRGIFTSLTLAALEELSAEGLAFVFNTPNDQSRPGYLKMGWQVIGRVPVAIRPTGPWSLSAIARARSSASLAAVATSAGRPAAAALAELYTSVGHGGYGRPHVLRTSRSPEFLRWRYGFGDLCYRVAALDRVDNGFAVFRLRRRGGAIEAVVDDVLVRDDDPRTARKLMDHIAASSGADYLIRIDPRMGRSFHERFVPLPRSGPVLVARALAGTPPRAIRSWGLTMGDIELF